MKAIIIHRWGGNPNEPLYKWLKKEIKSKGWEAEIPEMPNPEEPIIEEWISKLKELEIDEETCFIGHSIGCQAILRYLEQFKGRVKRCVFIAPWTNLDKKTMEEEGEEVQEIASPWIKTPIDWNKVREKCGKFVCIFSDNDYYVPLSEKEVFQTALVAEAIIEHEKGHFTEDDGVVDLPIVLEKLE